MDVCTDYPRMLYRPGTAYQIWGRDLDTLIVDDAAEEEKAAQQGWRRSPDALDHDGNGKKGGRVKRNANLSRN